MRATTWTPGSVGSAELPPGAVDGAAELVPQPPPEVPVPIDADFGVDPELAAQGAALYGLCQACHGPRVISGGMAPDLRASYLVPSEQLFTDVVREGSRAVGGMPVYEELTDEQLRAIQHYIRQRAEAGLDAMR